MVEPRELAIRVRAIGSCFMRSSPAFLFHNNQEKCFRFETGYFHLTHLRFDPAGLEQAAHRRGLFASQDSIYGGLCKQIQTHHEMRR